MSMTKTDYHSHILPGVDDGARDLKESLNMANAASMAGFTSIIATPHYEDSLFENYRTDILQSVLELNRALEKAGIAIQVYPGSEVMLSPHTPRLLRERKIMTLLDEGKLVLVELPLTIKPLWTLEVLHQIRLIGITPVLAHPERYTWLQNDTDFLPTVQKMGIKLQGNLSSLKGKYGGSVKAFGDKLNRQGLIDLWGSDAHSVMGYEILCKRKNIC